MSWSRLTVSTALLVLLTGCGFQSVYGTKGGDGSAGSAVVQRELASIRVLPIADRIGQKMRNRLLTLLNPKGRPAHPKYKLNISLGVSEEQLGVQSTALSSRANLRVWAHVTLTPEKPVPRKRASGYSAFSYGGYGGTPAAREAEEPESEVLLHTSRLVVAGYNIFSSEFATETAREDAEDRATRELAHELQSQLAIFFSQPAAGSRATKRQR